MTPGALLGERYRLLGQIDFGGMGTVWLAEDEDLGRAVAVKLLRDDLAHDAGQRRRFQQEAKHLARIRDPGVATVHDWREETTPDGRPLCYCVMDLIDGSSLTQVLSEAPLPTATVMLLLGQVARALRAVHAEGIIHRDIKPANIIVDGDRAVLVDFGIALADGGSRHTSAGKVMGTSRYLAPECLDGDDPTTAADIYALAVLACRCLRGTEPFAYRPPPGGDRRWDELRAELAEHIPAESAALVCRALSPEPAERPDAAELARSFESAHAAAGDGRSDLAPPAAAAAVATPVTKSLRRRRITVAAVTVAVTAVLITAAILVPRLNQPDSEGSGRGDSVAADASSPTAEPKSKSESESDPTSAESSDKPTQSSSSPRGKPPSGPVSLVDAQGRCLTSRGDGESDVPSIRVDACAGGAPNQQFTLTADGGGYQLRDFADNCVWLYKSDWKIHRHDCAPGRSWDLKPAADAAWRPESLTHPGRCMQTVEPGSFLDANECSSTAKQTWTFS